MALMSTVFFGVNPIVLAGGLQHSNSSTAVFVGLLSGLTILMMAAPGLGGLNFDQLTAQSTGYFILSGIFGVILGRSALYMAIKRLGSARASTIKHAAPVVTAFLALIYLHEQIGIERWGGIALVTIGLMIMGNMLSKKHFNRMTLSGAAFASLAPISYGIRPIFSKIGLNLAPLPLTATFISYLTAVIAYAAFFLLLRRPKLELANSRSLVHFALAGVMQVLGLLLLNAALNQSDVTMIYPISASAPLLTFLLSFTFLKNVERLTFWDLIGTISVVLGVVVLLI